MRVAKRSSLRCRASVASLLFSVILSIAPAWSEEYFDRYDLTPRGDTVDLAVQPNAYPLAFISTVMQHDKLLAADLKKQGLQLKIFAYNKGPDIVRFVGGGKIEMAFLGDMPTVNTIASTPTLVIGLGKRNFSSVVSHEASRLEQLRGKKVGYAAGTSSHLVLLRGLEAAKMSERDVELKPMEPAQMPDALEDGSIAAFSAWEPTPSIAFERNPKNKAIYRAVATDWVVFARDFAEKKPDAANALIASYVRAINWMRKKPANLEQAADWVLAGTQAFTGAPPKLSKNAAIEIARRDLLGVSGAPAIPAKIDGEVPLARELAFLKGQGKISAQVDDSVLKRAFAYEALKQIQAQPQRYKVFTFDYAK